MIKNILTLWNPFIDIESICKLCLLVDSKIYGFFAKLYSFYIDLASRRIFNQEAIDSLANRIYIFVGIIALFFLAYTLLKTLVDPEKGLKEGGGKLVFKIASSLIMLLLVPVIFEFGYKVQEIIINENVLGKIFLGTETEITQQSQSIQYSVENDSGSTEFEETNDVNYSEEQLSKEILKVYGNQTAYLVLNAFLYPTTEDDFHVDASDEFNLDSGVKAAQIGVVAGAGIATVAVIAVEIITSPASGGATLAGIPAALKAFAGSIALAGAIGGAAGVGVNVVGYAVTADRFTWTDAQIGMIYGGSFDYITAFSEAIEEGNMEYVPIISTICGVILVYFMLGFCIDLGIRAAKLAVYQMLAPVPILLRIVPGQDKVFNTWFKEVVLTFFEVLVRIGILFGVAYLISLVPGLTIFSDSGGGLFAKAVIVLGLVAFIKEAPKLLSDVIGIKSSSKIGFSLKDKLAAGGALTVAAAAGAGATAFLRNGTTGIRNAWNKGKDGDKKGAWKAAGVGALSAIAGGFSGAVRGGKAAASAKGFADVKDAAGKGAQAAGKKAQDRATYKANHGGTFSGAMLGRITDAGGDARDWLFGSYDAYESELKYYDYLNKQESAVKSETEKIRKKYANNATIVAQKVKYKGYSHGELDSLHKNLVIDQKSSLDVLERELSTLSGRTSFNAGEVVKYFDEATGKWLEGYINEAGQVFEQAGFDSSGKVILGNKVADSASLLHNNYVSAFSSFVAQLTKETDLGLQDAAGAKSGTIYDLIKSDSATLTSSLSQIADIYSEGLNQKAVQDAKDKIAKESIGGAGHVYKAYMDAITERTAEINAEKAKADRLREARKKDK